jgi:hypothetical protein
MADFEPLSMIESLGIFDVHRGAAMDRGVNDQSYFLSDCSEFEPNSWQPDMKML